MLLWLGGCGRIAFDPIGTGDGGTGSSGGDGSTGPQTLVFRDGLDGYSGTVDTYLDLANPDADHHMDLTVRWLDDAPAIQSQQHALLFFDLFFGSKVLPPGSEIQSAMLRVSVVEASVPPAGTLAEVALDWGSTASWNTFGATPGVQPSDVRGIALPAPTQAGMFVFDVTPSVAAWSADPSTNNGWIISPAPMNGDAVAIASSESADPTQRPELTITFVAP